MKTRKLELRSAETSATTYTLITPPGETYRSWACCTVNDVTGELLITSDFGSWSYRWSPSPAHLGEPTLTAFLGRSRTEMDYLAMKLLGRDGARRFSAAATAKHLQGLLCKRRLLDGQEVNEQLRDLLDDEPEIKLAHAMVEAETYVARGRMRWDDGLGRHREPEPHNEVMSRWRARHLFDAIDGIASDVGGGGSEVVSTLFLERFMQLDGYAMITQEPWEDVQTEVSPEYTVLTETILPALCVACKATHTARIARGFFHGAPQIAETAEELAS